MIIRYCLRLLLSVRELHRLGYECLRIAPGLNASGSAWRCALAPAALMKPRHGALLDRPVDELVAYYSSAEERRYFGEPARFGGSRQLLAGMIVQRFPALVRQSYGADQPYVRWFSDVVRLGRRGVFPVAYTDWPETAPDGFLSTSDGFHTQLRLPPSFVPIPRS